MDGQLAYAAGGTPSKPHEWMVSNPLSPNPSTAAMQAQDCCGRYWKLIITGLINPKDNEASEKKAEQLAGVGGTLAASPLGLNRRSIDCNRFSGTPVCSWFAVRQWLKNTRKGVAISSRLRIMGES